MSVNVYAWPPVAPRRWEWTMHDPIQESASIITGAVYRSAFGRRRRLATLEVSGRRDGMGAGYMESLKELLRGGEHAVRLSSYPINPHFDVSRNTAARQSAPFGWRHGESSLGWTATGSGLLWYTGAYLRGTTGTDELGFATVTVSGLAPGVIAARPSEFVTIFEDEDDAVGVTVRVLAPAVADGSGEAVIRLHDSPGTFIDARINLGTFETAAFRPVAIPRSAQPAQGDWTYSWEFREVFEDEVGTGGFVEVDPWN